MRDVQEPILDIASVPLQSIPTAWLYQPLWSGTRPARALEAVGLVPSYESPNARGVEVLPARSVQVPVVVPLSTSGVLYVLEVHDSTPEVASVPLQVIPTAWLYQPL